MTYNHLPAFNKYTVLKKIGTGAFGTIYVVHKTQENELFAMKVSKGGQKTLSLEKDLMEELQQSPYFPRFIDYHESSKEEYLVMEIMGPSLKVACDNISEVRFTLSTALRVGVEMLRCIRAFHNMGFVHRDIKPGNFLIRGSKKYPIALIDYGIARRYSDPKTQQIFNPRSFAGFVGTRKYASINAHEGREQGPCDDLFSWFVSLLEITTGKLPWRTSDDKIQLLQMKKKADIERFCTFLPRQYFQIYSYIMTLGYYDTPNYDLIIALLCEAMDENNAKWADKFDWEMFSPKRRQKISLVSLIPKPGEKPNIPQNLPSTNVDIPPYRNPFIPTKVNAFGKLPQASRTLKPVYNNWRNAEADVFDSCVSVASVYNSAIELTISSIYSSDSDDCSSLSSSSSIISSLSSTVSTLTVKDQQNVESNKSTTISTAKSVQKIEMKIRFKNPALIKLTNKRKQLRMIHYKDNVASYSDIKCHRTFDGILDSPLKQIIHGFFGC